MTGRDLVASALRLIGAVATGETPSANEATDGLAALNLMLDSWSNESLLIPNTVREVFPLTPGKQAYTIGTGGDFVTSRPIAIEQVLIQLSTVSPVLELPMKLLTEEEFAGIILKPLTSTFPLYGYAEGTYPLETLNVWPVPNVANNIVIYSAKALTQLTLDTATSLPPGYERALKYNLALELAPEYGKTVSDAVVAIAVESKAVLKRKNTKPRYLRVDDALKAKPAVWNWMTGEPT